MTTHTEVVKRLREYNGNAPLLQEAADIIEDFDKAREITRMGAWSQEYLVKYLNKPKQTGIS